MTSGLEMEQDLFYRPGAHDGHLGQTGAPLIQTDYRCKIDVWSDALLKNHSLILLTRNIY